MTSEYNKSLTSLSTAQKMRPNKSSLFGSIDNNARNSTPNIAAAAALATTPTGSASPMSAKSSSVSPIILVGGRMSPKPSLPAKPQNLVVTNPANVMRHHSMNVPRDSAAQMGGRISTPAHFATCSGSSVSKRMAPKPPIMRPTEAPPKPPTAKTPSRSVSNASLSEILQKSSDFVGGVNKTLVQATANPSSLHGVRAGTPETPTADSNDNVRTVGFAKDKTSTGSPVSLTGGQLPLHRTMPAPPPPQRQTGNGSVPAAPKRHTSSARPQTTGSDGSSIALNQSITDIDLKFGSRFHNVTEFSKPPPFLNVLKIYPSRCG